ncbi:hypothetical protein HG531_003170 [Fusarium graminearum]|nr:hypothetical protein HG531_003170 [Fusarium graminearum]
MYSFRSARVPVKVRAHEFPASVVCEITHETTREYLAFSKNIAACLANRCWPLCAAKPAQSGPPRDLLLVQAIEEYTVVYAFQLVTKDDIWVSNINLSKEERKNIRLLLFQDDQATVSLLCKLVKAQRERLAMWTDDRESPARQFLSRSNVRLCLFVQYFTKEEKAAIELRIVGPEEVETAVLLDGIFVVDFSNALYFRWRA